MPPDKVVQIWKEIAEPELIEHFTAMNEKYLSKAGNVVDGSEVQGICNSVFGARLDENVVSEYGVALTFSLQGMPVPVYVLGVSVKDFPHHNPLTF